MTPQNKPTKENLLKDTEINATFYQITLQFFFSTIFSLILFFITFTSYLSTKIQF